jgi:N-acetylmuramoyl-L-alanine amidase
MKRREFLAGAGAVFLAGCAGQGQRDWSEVPWVATGATPTPPPTTLPYVHASPPVAATPPPAPAPRAALPVRAAPPPAAPRLAPAGGSGWRLVPRAAWGAQPLKGNHDPMGAITRITLHHTDEHAGMRGRTDEEVVRAIQAYHRDSLGWADIGYHYLVGRDGRVYEGRALTAQGAHSGGANNKNNLGISVIGNFSCGLPPTTQLHALAGFLADRRAAYRVPACALLGHRDLGSTECPGSSLYAWLQDAKRRA